MIEPKIHLSQAAKLSRKADPPLFRTAQLLVATNKNQVRYGTVGTPASFWSKWAELEDSDADVVAAVNSALSVDENRQTFADGFREDRNYVSCALLTGGTSPKNGAAAKARGQRIPAVSLEALVTRRIRGWLGDGVAVLNAIRHQVSEGTAQQSIVDGAARLAIAWQHLRPDEVRGLLLSACRRVQVHTDRVDLTVSALSLIQRFDPQITNLDGIAAPALSGADAFPFVLTIPARLRRSGIEMRMVVDDGSEPAAIDPGLVRTLVRAFAIRDQLFKDHSLTLNDIANREGIVASYATRLFRLTFLAPDIVATILDGRHPPELTVCKLLDDTRLPLDWSEQRARLGFA